MTYVAKVLSNYMVEYSIANKAAKEKNIYPNFNKSKTIVFSIGNTKIDSKV